MRYIYSRDLCVIHMCIVFIYIYVRIEFPILSSEYMYMIVLSRLLRSHHHTLHLEWCGGSNATEEGRDTATVCVRSWGRKEGDVNMVTNMNAPMCLLISRTTYSHQENEVQPHEYQLLRGAPEMERRGQQQETEHGAAGAPRASLSEEVAHTDNFVGRCPYCDVRVGDAEEEDELFGKIKDSDGVDILRHDGAVISRIHFFIRSRRCADNSVKYLLGDPNSTFRTYIVYPAGNTRYMVERGILYPLALGTKIYIHGFTPNSQKYILQFMTERNAITRLSSGGRRVPVPRNRDTIQTMLFPVRGTNTPPIVHEEAGGHTPGQQEVARRIRRRESSDEESDDGWRAIPPHKAQRLRQGSLAPRAQELEIGDEVEVCEKAEGYRGSWARARIVNFTKNKARCEVEYLDLDDDNTKKRYRVRMDVRSTKLVTVPNSGIGTWACVSCVVMFGLRNTTD